MKIWRHASSLLTCATVLFLASLASQAQVNSARTAHLRREVANGQARLLGPMSAAQSLRLHIALPLRDQAGLDRFLAEVTDPSRPNYRHFLTVSEFADRFGPSQADYDTLTRYVTAGGFSIVGGSREGMDIQIEGSVATVETAFHVRMGLYQHPTENRTFFSPDREPIVDLPFPLWHVSGLDNFSEPHPMLAKRSDYAAARGLDPKAVVSHATTGSGPSGSFFGSDMRAAYYGGALTGTGQNLGLLEYAGTNLADLNTYFTNAHQTNNVPITLLSTDGTSTSCVASGRRACDDTEQTLDMTQALGMAPGLASLVVYVGSSDTAILSAMTTHNPLPTSIGCSWGWTPADPATDNPYFQRMAAQGQTFFVASGDNSTWTKSGKAEAWPSDDAYVVGVGGTDLVTSSAAGPWQSETTWVDGGGGVSPDQIAIPSWQQIAGVINSANKGSTTYRNGPDVAANANFTFYVCADQTACTANEYGGTSFAAPMWAGYMALVNQQAAANKNAPLGFINPDIYPLLASAGYAANFHDVTSGTSGSYSAVAGYDLVTGLGSPNGSGLINALSIIPAPPNFTISATPTSVVISRGSHATSTIGTSVSGGFDSALTLTSSGQPSGVTVTFAPGSIAAPGSGTSTMTITVPANARTGSSTITVTASGGGTTHTATVALTISR